MVQSDDEMRERQLFEKAGRITEYVKQSTETEAIKEMPTVISRSTRTRQILGNLGVGLFFFFVIIFVVCGTWVINELYDSRNHNIPVIETANAMIASSTPTYTPSPSSTSTATPTETPSPSDTPTETDTPTDFPTDAPTEFVVESYIEKLRGNFFTEVYLYSAETGINYNVYVDTALVLEMFLPVDQFQVDFTICFYKNSNQLGCEEKSVYTGYDTVYQFIPGLLSYESEDFVYTLTELPDSFSVDFTNPEFIEEDYEVNFFMSMETGLQIQPIATEAIVIATNAQVATSAATQTWTPSPTPFPSMTATIWSPTVRCEPQVSIEQLDAVMWAVFIHLDDEPAGCIMPPAGYIDNGLNRTRGNEATYEIASLLSSTGQQLYMAAIEDGFTGKISVVGQPPFVANGFHFTYQPESNPISSVVIRFLGGSEPWEFTVIPTFVPLSLIPSLTPSWTPPATASLTPNATNTVAVRIVESTATEIVVLPTFVPLPTEQPSVQVIIGPEGSGGQVNRSITLILSAELAEEIHTVTGNNSVNCRISFRNNGNIVYDEVSLNPSITVNSAVGQPVNSSMSINYIQPITTTIVICHNRDEWRFVVSVEIQN